MPTGADPNRTLRSSLIFWGAAALFAVAFVVVSVAAQVLLLVFAGVLFGAALRGIVDWVSAKLGWRRGLVATLLGALALAVIVAAGLWIVPRVAEQAQALADKLAEAYEHLRRTLANSPPGQRALDALQSVGLQAGSFARRAAGVLTSAVGVLSALIFVLFLTIYAALDADLYRSGLVRLIPPRHRERADEVVGALATTLRRWLLGRMVSMMAVGVVTTVVLWLMGIPLPVPLGLIAALFGFVPNIGPLVSAAPALLVAATISPMHAVYVLVLYLGVNLLDGYVLTPWIQRRAVSLPPALILTGQVLFGTFWGVLGVTLATPLMACLVVLTRKLYVRALEAS